ncbi:hypothetical protein AB6Q85_003294 [Vibrio cholerae]
MKQDEIRIRFHGEMRETLIKLSEAAGISPTRYINELLITQYGLLTAKEDNNEKDSSSN